MLQLNILQVATKTQHSQNFEVYFLEKKVYFLQTKSKAKFFF